MYYTQEQIDRANQADLVLFLQSQGEQLTHAGQEYRWKRHDSLTVRGNKWYRHSQSKGGGPVDFVMEFFGKSFTEAVELLTGEQGAAAPDRPSPAPLSDFRLPPRSDTAGQVKSYLTEARRIDEDVMGFFFASGDIYEEAAHHNAVFVGRDESGIPRYAHQRGTAGSFRLDVKGSDKTFNFSYRGAGERLFVFEAPIDLLSFLCLFKKEWQKQSYLALGGVGEKALLRFLSDRPNIKTVFLCLDSDEAGNDACSRLAELVPEGLTVHRLIPLFKDWNEVLQHRAEITDGKYLREAIYGLKEPPQEETVEIMCANGLTVTVQQVYSVNWMLMLTFIPGIIYIWFRYRKPREYKNVDVDLSAYNAVESTKLELRHWISIIAVLVVTAVEFKTQSLAVAALAGLVIMFFSGAVKWKDIEERFNDGIRMMGSIAFIMLVAGGFGMVMRATGGVNALVERSASALSSSHLLAATVITLIGLVVTMGIGTSFGTIPVIAVLFVPLCTKLGFSPAATILMISSAAALGDAGSPASDATLGPTCGLNADGQHDHIWDTCVPTFGALNIPLMIGTIIIAQFI